MSLVFFSLTLLSSSFFVQTASAAANSELPASASPSPKPAASAGSSPEAAAVPANANAPQGGESWYYPPDQGSGSCEYLLVDTCVEPTLPFIQQSDYYIGHDEPQTEFISSKPGSGNNMLWQTTLPGADPTPTQTGSKIANFELYTATWFGLAACDPNSFSEASGSYSACTPNSDTNSQNSGEAFMELQFYPPGLNCSTTQWCARMQFNSWIQPLGGVTSCNNGETFTDVYVTTDGNPHNNKGNDGNNLLMSSGDTIQVKIFDTSNGIEADVHDVTSGNSGSMVASGANGFTNTNLTTCASESFNYHPAYDTAKAGNCVGWTYACLNAAPGEASPVGFAFETGHFELCGDSSCSTLPDGDSDDAGCQTVNGVGGCFGKDTDFDGVPYHANWPDGNSNHPSTWVFGSPDGKGFGPLSFTGGSYQEGYNQILFTTTASLSPPPAFYPFWDQAGSGSSCTFQFGNDPTGATNDFGKDAQYGGTPINNPCLPGTFDYTITASPSDKTVLAGESAQYTATLTLLSGSPTAVTLSETGGPSGSTPTFSPASVAPTISGATSTLSVATSATGGIGDLAMTVQGAGPTRSTSVNLHVYKFTVGISPSDVTVLRGRSASYAVTLTLVGGSTTTGVPSIALSSMNLPSDSSASFTPASVTPIFGGATSTLQVGTASAPGGSLGDFGFTVVGSDGSGGSRTGTASLHIYDFSMAVSADETVLRGAQGIYTVTAKLVSGSSTIGTPMVTLAATTGLPGDATAGFAPASVTPTALGASSTLTVTTGSSSLGDFAFTLTGTPSTGGSRSASGGLHIYDFTLMTTPTSLNILTTGSNAYSVSVTLDSGSTGTGLPAISLSISGLPSGATDSFSPSSGSASGFTSTLTITTSDAPSGTYVLTLTGTDGRSPEGGARTVQPALVVLTPAQALQLIINQVNGFESGGVLNGGQANSLIVKLNGAIGNLNHSPPRVTTACNQLNAFVYEVNSYEATGILTQEQANQLLAGPLGVEAIMAAIPC